ncbi:endonuclease/exonuclease/phosphatase family protein [Orbaceae bacterium ESL0727]|nr:endonuclease/exonuclease/phosphatase family protein [Orbaceae bacterium ESL0727]
MFKRRDYTLRYQAGSDVELILPQTTIAVKQPLIRHHHFSILVWNIFKQKRIECIPVLEEYIDNTELMLLQEAQNSAPLLNLITQHNKIADQVPAYSFNDLSVGVMTVANSLPICTFSFKEKEPLIRVPKSALITIYPIDNSDKTLLVANVHAINFSIGVKIYQQQIRVLLNKVNEHCGPVILAGDFNAWSRQRLNLLYHLIRTIELKPVNFTVDMRKTFMGRPLDFVFYRGLELTSAQIIQTNASDHNPLLAQFRLG